MERDSISFSVVLSHSGGPGLSPPVLYNPTIDLMQTTAEYYADEVRFLEAARPLTRLRRLYNPVVVVAAFLWRRLLFRTTFIAITGSSGKTTAKECLYAILASRYPSTRTRGSRKARYELPRMILRTRPWHRFAVAEIGIIEPGIMWRSALLFRPDIAVVLNVNSTHMESFRDLDTTAREKGKLVEGLTRRGVAVLNGDDPRVSAMASRAPDRSVLFGESDRFDFWAEAASSRWPARLSFEAHEQGNSSEIQTRFIGKHWTNAVLAAIAAARCCGISLRDCVAPIAKVPPFVARMEPLPLPSGATLVRDDRSGSIETFEACLAVLEDYKQGRSVLIVTQIRGVKMGEKNRLRYIAERAAETCDVCVFVGRKSEYARRRAIAFGMAADRVRAFRESDGLLRFLADETRSTDLIVLKGRRSDALGRIAEEACRSATTSPGP